MSIYNKIRAFIGGFPRSYKFWCQRRKRGWDDSDTWSLYTSIAEFILPRLIRFKEVNNGFPDNLTSEKWDEILDKMIFAMDYIAREDDTFGKELEDNWEKVQEGLDLFNEYFFDLWW